MINTVCSLRPDMIYLYNNSRKSFEIYRKYWIQIGICIVAFTRIDDLVWYGPEKWLQYITENEQILNI